MGTARRRRIALRRSGLQLRPPASSRRPRKNAGPLRPRLDALPRWTLADRRRADAAARGVGLVADEVEVDIGLAARNQVGDRLARTRGHRPAERAVTGIQIEVRITLPCEHLAL